MWVTTVNPSLLVPIPPFFVKWYQLVPGADIVLEWSEHARATRGTRKDLDFNIGLVNNDECSFMLMMMFNQGQYSDGEEWPRMGTYCGCPSYFVSTIAHFLVNVRVEIPYSIEYYLVTFKCKVFPTFKCSLPSALFGAQPWAINWRPPFCENCMMLYDAFCPRIGGL